MNTTIAVNRAVPSIASRINGQVSRFCVAARMSAPTTPIAPASVGVAIAISIPGKPPIEPSTVKIKIAEGTIPFKHFRHSGQPFKVRASLGTPGTYSGLNRATKKV